MKKIKIEYTHNNEVARVILDDGKGNVLDSMMMAELIEAFNAFKAKAGLKLITFEGAGKHFSFGASVEEHKKEMADAMLKTFHQLFFLLRDIAIPTVAKVSGQCLGGGFELALGCNFIFADKTARMGLPEITLGVFPPPASLILPLKIGLGRAEEMLITGRSINAEEAQLYGLVSQVFEDRASMDAGTVSWAEKFILPRSASSLRYCVKAVRYEYNYSLTNYLPVLKKIYVNELMRTNDANEGIVSFLEKRQPEWKNC